MKVTSQFIIVKHDAKKARLHYDLRFKMPQGKNWASFAVRKGVPISTGTKVLAVRTHDHTPKEALFLGNIEQGYGAGKLAKWDGGPCIIIKYTTAHMAIEFQGRKVKGMYHLINTAIIKGKRGASEYKNQGYMLFKGKTKLNEVLYKSGKFDASTTIGKYSDKTGMKSGIGSQDVEIDDEQSDKQQKKPLPWAPPKAKYSGKLSVKGFLNDYLQYLQKK